MDELAVKAKPLRYVWVLKNAICVTVVVVLCMSVREKQYCIIERYDFVYSG